MFKSNFTTLESLCTQRRTSQNELKPPHLNDPRKTGRMCASQHGFENPVSTAVCANTAVWTSTLTHSMQLCSAPLTRIPGQAETLKGLSTTSQDGMWAAVKKNEPAMTWPLQLHPACSAPHFSALQGFHRLASETKRLDYKGPQGAMLTSSSRMPSGGRVQTKCFTRAIRISFTPVQHEPSQPSTTLPHYTGLGASTAWQELPLLRKNLSQGTQTTSKSFSSVGFPLQDELQISINC